MNDFIFGEKCMSNYDMVQHITTSQKTFHFYGEIKVFLN